MKSLKNHNTHFYNYFEIFILATISAVLLCLCFPLTNYYYLSFFGLSPLLMIFITQNRRKSLFAMFIFICVYLGWMMNWITYFHFIAYPGMLLLVFLMYGLALLIFKKLVTYFPQAHIFLLPMVFTSLEYLRTIGFLRYPYGNIGYALGHALEFSQVAEWTGHLGLSFFLYLTNTLLASGFIHRVSLLEKIKQNKLHLFFNKITLVLFLIISLYFIGNNRLEAFEKQKTRDEIKLALLQPWFDFNQAWNYENRLLVMNKLFNLSLMAKPFKPDLIIWPETALLSYYEFNLQYRGPYVVNYERFFKQYNNNQQLTHFLVGTLGRTMNNEVQTKNKDATVAKGVKTASASDTIKIYNTALLLDAKGDIKDRYSKQLLVPFAEWFPYIDSFPFKYLPFVKNILVSAKASQFTPGEKQTIFEHPLFKFGVLICYEDSFGEFVRMMVKKGADILIVLTNDAWSYSEKSERLHNLFSRFRAIENRKPVIRATNAGITCIIDPLGRITKILKPFKEDLLLGKTKLNDVVTFYTLYGNFIYLLLTILTISLLPIGLVVSKLFPNKQY